MTTKRAHRDKDKSQQCSYYNLDDTHGSIKRPAKASISSKLPARVVQHDYNKCQGNGKKSSIVVYRRLMMDSVLAPRLSVQQSERHITIVHCRIGAKQQETGSFMSPNFVCFESGSQNKTHLDLNPEAGLNIREQSQLCLSFECFDVFTKMTDDHEDA
jgi:hypothetical protein